MSRIDFRDFVYNLFLAQKVTLASKLKALVHTQFEVSDKLQHTVRV